jgi:DNA-binding response OmpR family regulator
MNTILIVEDDSNLRMNLDAILSGEGFNVILAEDGLVGYELAVKHLPDLIVVDICMKNCNGYELLNKLQNNPATASISFIFLTSKTDTCDMLKGLSYGADDYITKPFDIDDLLDAIKVSLFKTKKSIPDINKIKPAKM